MNRPTPKSPAVRPPPLPIKRPAVHCPVVAEVMSEIAADYFPGVRMIEGV